MAAKLAALSAAAGCIGSGDALSLSPGSRHGGAFLATDSDLQPEQVAATLVSVEDEWQADVSLYNKDDCDGSGKNTEVDCERAPESFEKSCGVVVKAVLEGSDGKRSNANEYLDQVCGEDVLEGWHKEQCQVLSQSIVDAMNLDSYANRQNMDLRHMCSGIWTKFVSEEKGRAVKEKTERKERDAKEAADMAATQAAEEAARKAEAVAKAKAEEEAAQAKSEEAAKNKAEVEEKAQAEAEAKAKAAEVARAHEVSVAKAEAEKKAKAAAQAAKEKAEDEALAKVRADARSAAEEAAAKAKEQEQANAQAAEVAKAQAKAKAEEDARAKEEAAAKLAAKAKEAEAAAKSAAEKAAKEEATASEEAKTAAVPDFQISDKQKRAIMNKVQEVYAEEPKKVFKPAAAAAGAAGKFTITDKQRAHILKVVNTTQSAKK